MNIQLTSPSGVLYSYFLEPEEQAVIPFSEGSGDYSITCYQQVDGSQYAALYAETLTVKLQNEFLPFPSLLLRLERTTSGTPYFFAISTERL